jgi:hypothetical protein
VASFQAGRLSLWKSIGECRTAQEVTGERMGLPVMSTRYGDASGGAHTRAEDLSLNMLGLGGHQNSRW